MAGRIEVCVQGKRCVHLKDVSEYMYPRPVYRQPWAAAGDVTI